MFRRMMLYALLIIPTLQLGARFPGGGSFRDPVDGAFDMTAWLLSPGGVLPLPFIITEPAVDYAADLALSGISIGDVIDFDTAEIIGAGEIGFRYRIARELKMSMGVDVAAGNKGWAVSIVMGNAWR